jgi:hypothetical protein
MVFASEADRVMEWRMESGELLGMGVKLKVENGEWRIIGHGSKIESGEWRVENYWAWE